MEARVEQFHTDAQKAIGTKTPKDIEKLRKFLYKNQDYRFTDREQSHLFHALQQYVTAFSNTKDPDNPALGLLEDALKMPFTVFSTSQKKTMLKWLDKLSGNTDAEPSPNAPKIRYQVIDCSVSSATLMSPDGDTEEVGMREFNGSIHADLMSRWQQEQLVEVERASNGNWAIVE